VPGRAFPAGAGRAFSIILSSVRKPGAGPGAFIERSSLWVGGSVWVPAVSSRVQVQSGSSGVSVDMVMLEALPESSLWEVDAFPWCGGFFGGEWVSDDLGLAVALYRCCVVVFNCFRLIVVSLRDPGAWTRSGKAWLRCFWRASSVRSGAT